MKKKTPNFVIGLLRFSHLAETTNCADIVPLDSIMSNALQVFTLEKGNRHSTFYIMIKMRPKNHFSSLHFSAKIVGGDDNSKESGTFVYLGEQLTVAYF